MVTNRPVPLALKVRVAVITAITHVEGNSAATCRLERAAWRGLCRRRLAGAAIGCRHAGSLGLELTDRTISGSRNAGSRLGGLFDAEEGDRRLQLLGLRGQFFRGRGDLFRGAGVL